MNRRSRLIGGYDFIFYNLDPFDFAPFDELRASRTGKIATALTLLVLDEPRGLQPLPPSHEATEDKRNDPA